MSERTPEEREAARRERERRRALKEGRPLPPDPPAPFDVPLAADPQATQVFDVATEWTGETAAVAAPDEPVAESAGPTAADPSWAEPAPDPPAPVAEPRGERAPAAPATRVFPSPTPPGTTDPDVPLGTRRVSALERMHIHGPRRPGRRGSRGGGGAGAPPPVRPLGSRPPRRRASRLAAVAALLLALAAGWFLVSLFQPFTGDGGERVVVRVPKGATASQIGDLLDSKGVVSSAFFFELRAQLAGKRGALRSGTFTLRKDMSYGAALDVLTTAPKPPPVVRITIPEGRTRAETAGIAKQAGIDGDYIKATRRSKLLDPHRYGAPRDATLEGFLFPATYELKLGSKVDKLVAQQLAALKQNLGSVDLRGAKRKNLTVFDVLTIASMVEREVAVAKERPLVAAVIYNRLHDGMPLGIDATLRYALNDWTHPLTQSQLANPTPYNTRTHQGLPPGPIGNPGLASIKAAAHPAHVPYLYYVVKPGTCGEHAFSSTDAQFQQDVAAYNAAREKAGGKSPEKC
jgi:peptidoglycan lytic transglycosylase G